MLDAHVHYASEPLYSHLDREAQDARKAGVRWAVNAPVNLETSRLARSISQGYPWILPCLGVHPLFIGEGAPPMDEFEALAREGGFVAVGEVGLDFWEGRAGPAQKQQQAQQREVLHNFALLAKRHSLPMVLHARKSLYEALSTVRRTGYGGGGLVHAFSGSFDMASAALDDGFYLGASTLLGRPDKRALREVFARVPRERVLVETDAPDMAPLLHRGRGRGSEHRPCELVGVVAALAEVWGLDFDETAQITIDNGLRLFGIDSSGELTT